MSWTRCVRWALFGSLASSTTLAQETAGRVRLSLDGELVGYRSTQTTIAVTDPVTNAERDLEEEAATSSLGLLSSGAAVGLGYGLGPGALLGVRTLLTQQTVELGQFGESESSVVVVTPYFEYLFRAGRTTRPFIGVEAGVEQSSAKAGKGTHARSAAGVFGIFGGIHAFVAPGLALDGALVLDGLAGQQEYPGGLEGSTSGVRFSTRLGLSGWLGKGRRGPAVAAPASEVPAEEAPVEAPAEPQATAQSRIVRGVVSESLVVDSETVLSVQARPLSQPGVVQATLVRRKAEGAACSELALVIAGERHDAEGVRAEAAQIGGSSGQIVLGSWPRSALASVAQGGTTDVRIVGCGTQWGLRGVHLRQLQSLDATVGAMLDGTRLASSSPDVTLESGTLQSEFELSPTITLHLEGAPTSSRVVQWTVVVRGDEAKLTGCKAASVGIGEDRFDLAGVESKVEARSSRLVASVSGTVDIRALLAAAESRGKPMFTACSLRVPIAVGPQTKLWSFVQVFANRAIQANTWVEAPPVETPEPAGASPKGASTSPKGAGSTPKAAPASPKGSTAPAVKSPPPQPK